MRARPTTLLPAASDLSRSPVCRYVLCCAFSLARDLEAAGLEPFEVAQLGNLCPETAQEAKALIPSLDVEDRELDNQQLTDLLQSLAANKQFHT